MRKKVYMLLVLCFALPSLLWAQGEVRLAGHRFVPVQNVHGALRDALDLGESTGGAHNVLVQLDRLPDESMLASLESQGIVLGDYVGGNAYFALLKHGSKHPARVRGGVRVLSVMSLRPEWKLSPVLQSGDVPRHARVGGDKVEVHVFFAGNATGEIARAAFEAAGGEVVHVEPQLSMATVRISEGAVRRLASLPYVLAVSPIDPPSVAENNEGSTLSRATVLNAPFEQGGRGLLGEGVRIGIWDGNAISHPDFEDRVHVQEYEMPEQVNHGTHVTGTVLGAGILDARGRGMAPKAEAWTYNFNRQSNGKIEAVEMIEAMYQYGITLTQNSYGLPLNAVCQYYNYLAYNRGDYITDRVAAGLPTLTHVYAAGNNRKFCPQETQEHWGRSEYGTATRRAKNIISVGAVNAEGRLASYSAMGPHDDGRLYPIVSAKGHEVYSTAPDMLYRFNGGTSMSCPTVTGCLALVTERYRQLYRDDPRSDLLRALAANTADDAGRPGIDFMYGYGILNAERAVQSVEKGNFAFQSVAMDGTSVQKIALPEGAQGLRVMVVWNDPASNKIYEYGESPLVNDLDLIVRVGDKEVQPWVLNGTKGHVTDLPERKVDVLNNIEQVTLSSSELSGHREVVVEVTGTRVVQGRQPYALVWWIEPSAPMRIVAPISGDALLSGRRYYLRLEGLEGNFRVELSTDDGSTYSTIQKGEWPSGKNLQIELPSDLPLTDKGRLRVVDEATGRSIEVRDLRIAPAVIHVALKLPDCGLAGWKLTWDPSEHATKGYVVLRYDTDSKVWEKVGESLTNEFAISPELAKKSEKGIFAVAAKISEQKWGGQSLGVVGVPSQPTVVSADKLPIHETFTEGVSKLLHQGYTGNDIEISYKPQTLLPDLPLGSNVLTIWSSKAQNLPIPSSKIFDRTANPDLFSEWSICELDLTGMPQGAIVRVMGMLQHEEYADLPGVPVVDKSYPRFRILDNDEVLPSQYKSADGVQVPQPYLTNWIFELKGGVKHTLKLQYASRNEKDRLLILGFSVEPRREYVDLLVRLLERAQDGPRLGKATYKVRVSNEGDKDAENTEIRAYVNGVWQVTHQVPRIEPRGEVDVELEVDLSAPGTLGQQMEVKTEVYHKDDKALDNNVRVYHVKNLGDVFTHPISERLEVLGFEVDDDQNLEVVVDGPMIYTDNGGSLSNYPHNQKSTVKFVSSDPSMRVRLTLMEFATEDQSDIWTIWTAGDKGRDAHNMIDVDGVRVRDVLAGEQVAMPKTYVSEAADGGVVVRFESDGKVSKAGWVGRIDLVPAMNALSLLAVPSFFKNSDTAAEVPITLVVRNNLVTPVRNVGVYAWDRKDNYPIEEIVPEIKPGQQIVKLRKGFQSKSPKVHDLEFFIESVEDMDGSDNALSTRLHHDSHCPFGLIENSAISIEKLLVNRTEEELPAFNGELQYHTDLQPVVYKEPGSFPVRMTALRNEANAPTVFAIWVDWNEDLQFDAAEQTQVSIGAGEKVGTLQVNVPASAQPGLKRARVMLALPESVAKGACNRDALPKGDVRDITINLQKGADPSLGDIELVLVDAGPSGRNLKSDQPVHIEVFNVSEEDFAGKLSVKMEVDGKGVPVDDLDFAAAPLLQRAKRRLELSGKADLSPAGYHTVKVTIDEHAPSDLVKQNNTKMDTVYSIQSASDGFYAVHMKSHGGRMEYIDMSEVGIAAGDPGLDETRLVEMLVKMDYDQTGFLLHADGFSIYTHGGVGNIEPGTLVVTVGDGIAENKWIFATKRRVIYPGVWHHVAVTTDPMEKMPFLGGLRFKDVHIYIDGVKVTEIQRQMLGFTNSPTFGNLKLGPDIDGSIALFRISRAGAGSHVNRYKYLDATAMPQYVAGFSFTEGPGTPLVVSTPRTPGEANYSGKFVLEDPSRIEKQDGDALWVPIPKDKLFAQVYFEGQVGDWRWDEANKRYVVKFPKEVEESALANKKLSQVRTMWHGPVLKANGQVLDIANMTFDLSAGKSVALHGVRERVFGHTIEETVTIVAERDLSAAADLLSLTIAKEDNPGLLQSIPDLAGSESMVLKFGPETGYPTDLSKVNLTISISPEAKVVYKGQEYTGSKFAADLRSSISFDVVAPNGNRRTYSVRPVVEQQIEGWVTDELSYRYGDTITLEKNPLRARAVPSGLPLIYVSSNPTVASAAEGLLYVGKPGVAYLKAMQPGGGIYQPVESSEVRKVVVGKREVSVTVQQEAEYAEPITWFFEYEGLIMPSDAHVLPNPLDMGAYVLKDASDKARDPKKTLPVGTYTLKAVDKPYETALYTVTPKDGTLTVGYGERRQVSFEVSGVPSQEMADVQIVVENLHFAPEQSGRLDLAIPGGAKIRWKASKSGYSTHEGEFVVPTDADHLERIEMVPATLKLEYKVEASSQALGFIAGAATQMVAPGGMSEQVLAVAKQGYSFVGWGDGKKTPARRETGVQASAVYEARFAAQYYTLTYTIGEGGRLKAPLTNEVLSQRLQAGNASTKVAVEPISSDYYFVGWSDGTLELGHSVASLKSDMELKALFAKYPTLPGFMDFETSQDQWQVDAADKTFSLTSKPVNGWALDGVFAVFSALGEQTESQLLSPTYNITGVSGKDVAVQFDYFLPSGQGGLGQCKVEYSLDGSDWVEFEASLAPQDDPSERAPKEYILAASTLEGKSRLQLRWYFHVMNSADFYLLVDNIAIFAKESLGTTHMVTYAVEPANAGVVRGADGMPIAAPIEVAHGEKAGRVDAVPNEGYRFIGWKESGLKDASLLNTQPVLADATHTALFRSNEEVVVTYEAVPSGTGSLTVDGEPSSMQKLQRGAETKPIVAVAKPGYTFARWEDGSSSATRTLSNVRRDMHLRAQFVKQSFQVRFIVTAGGEPVPGAAIALPMGLYRTNGSGLALAMLEAGEHYYQIAAPNRKEINGKLKIESDATYEVDLEALTVEPSTDNVGLTFALVDIYNLPIPQAKVVVEGFSEVVSNSEGEAHFMLRPGLNYLYTITHERYATQSAELKLTEAGLTTKIVMTIKRPVLNFVASAGGRLEVTSEGKAVATGQEHEYGAKFLMKIIPDEHYVLESLLIGGEEHKESVRNGEIAFELTETATVEAFFGLPPIKLIAMVTDGAGPLEGARLSVEDYKPVQSDMKGRAVLRLKPGATYKYKVEKYGYTFVEGTVELKEETTVEAKLERIFHTITYKVGQGGEFSLKSSDKIEGPFTDVESGATLPYGTVIDLRVKPAEGMYLKLLKINAKDWTYDSDIVDKQGMMFNLIADLKITVEFSPSRRASVEEAVLSKVSAYPNPMESVLHLSGASLVDRAVLLNASGVAVRTAQLSGEDEWTFDVADLPAGVYLLQVERNGARRVLRIVKQ